MSAVRVARHGLARFARPTAGMAATVRQPMAAGWLLPAALLVLAAILRCRGVMDHKVIRIPQ